MKKCLLMFLLLSSGLVAKQVAIKTDHHHKMDTMNDPAMYPIDTYKKHEITPDYLARQCKAPIRVRSRFESWWKQNPEAQKLVEFDINDWKKNWKEGNEFLEKNNIKNMSIYNYVFRLPNDPSYVVQIAGPVNKSLNIFYYNGHGHPTWDDKKDDASFLSTLKQVPTYQTISRCANYLKYNEALELLKKKDAKVNIETQFTYMARIPGSDLKEVSDRTYVVLQHAYRENEMSSVKDNLPAMKNISNVTLEQLLEINAHVGLWFIADNLLISKKGGITITDFEQPKLLAAHYKYAYTDLQQPNLANPKDFYHKNKVIFAHEVIRGIEGILHLLEQAKAQDKYPVVIKWIADNRWLLDSFDEGQYNGLKRIYKRYFNEEL